MRPLISVVMPVYNAAPYLEAALKSVLSQSCTDFEILALDDSSTDESRSILRSFSDKRLKIVANESNIGVSKTLNRGLELAHGQFIARMDADDVCETSRFEEQVSLLESRPDVAVCGTFAQDIGEDDRPIGLRTLPTGKYLDTFWWRPSPIAHPTAMWRVREPAWRYDGDLKCAQDYDLWLQLGFHGLKFFNIAKPLLRYRVHSASISGRLSKEQWKQSQASFRKHSGLDINNSTFDSLCLRDPSVEAQARSQALRAIAKINDQSDDPLIRRDELLYHLRRMRRRIGHVVKRFL